MNAVARADTGDSGAAQDAEFEFVPESADDSTTAPAPGGSTAVWRVLAVDDDEDFQRSTAFALTGMQVLGRRIELLQAGSYAEAARLLAGERDIAVMLLDVVMETDDAGLRLTRALREVLGNAELRIVLVTGQPGLAPVREVMERYDINDYWTKSELGVERLRTLLTAGIRAWEQLRTVARARRGLQMIVEASNALAGARSLRDFSARTIAEIASVLGVPPEGVVCVRRTHGEQCVIGAAGSYARNLYRPLDTLEPASVREAIGRCLHERHPLVLADCTLLYFAADAAGAEYVAWVRTGRTLDATEQELLRVFALNIGSGLHNVALFSRLDDLAYRDPLLGLPNRNALLRALETALAEPGPVRRTLLLLDIDNFSGVNLTLGHAQGDALLQRIGKRLRSGLDPAVMVARLGGDSFGLLGPATLLEPVPVAGLCADASDALLDGGACSIGTARLPLTDFTGRAAEALATAMLLLKQAKRSGHGQHQEWVPALAEEAGRRYALLQALREALAHGEIGIELQPQIDLASGAVIGVEALARWRRADGSSVPPDLFIGLAEATGLILPLGEHIFALACGAANRLADAGFGHVRVAVNVSARQFQRADLSACLERQLRACGTAARRIEIEITESTAMQNYADVRHTLEQQRRLGHSVAIDDFGTGFSSLACLRHLPADLLKIDRSFVQEIGSGISRTAIADLIIQLANRLNLKTIAEGVETPAQASWLRARGCRYAQGWLYSRALPLDVLIPWMERHQGLVAV